MKINIDDKERVKAILDTVQVHCKARLVSWIDIKQWADKVEKRLEDLGVAKSRRKGTVFTWREGVHCNSYWYTPVTEIILVRGSGSAPKWFMTKCGREWSSIAPNARDYWVTFPEDVERAIVRDAMEKAQNCM